MNERVTSLGGQQYVPVKIRLHEFRKDHPDWRIETQLLDHDRQAGYALFRASIYDAQGQLIATGHGSADREEERRGVARRYLELAETRAIGRALNVAGYGTEYVLEESDSADTSLPPGAEHRTDPNAPTSVSEGGGGTNTRPLPEIPANDPIHTEIAETEPRLSEQQVRAIIEHARLLEAFDARYGNMRSVREIFEYTYRKFWLGPQSGITTELAMRRPTASQIARILLRKDRTTRLIQALRAMNPPILHAELADAVIGTDTNRSV